MVKENPTGGQARIAAELSVKLGICVSPRTVRAYWPEDPGGQGPRRTSSQHWRTFVHNHAQAIVASDFLLAPRWAPAPAFEERPAGSRLPLPEPLVSFSPPAKEGIGLDDRPGRLPGEQPRPPQEGEAGRGA